MDELHNYNNLLQSSYWGLFKSHYEWRPFAFRFRFSGKDTRMLLLYRDLEDGSGMAYVPNGPDLSLSSEEQGPFLEELSTALRRSLPPGCAFIRYDLKWKTPFAEGSRNCGWEDIRPDPRVREMRMNFGTLQWRLRKSATDIQPPDTIILDIDDSDQAILASMKPKTRYNIGLARRKGVRVLEAPNGMLDDWYSLYEETARRQGLTLHPKDYFETLLRLGETAEGEAPEFHLLLAEAESRLVSGIIVALWGDRATYLYGASTREKKEYMPSYALQWHAIRLARRKGCREYDLFGLPPSKDPAHRMYGLYRFKTGFGGRYLHKRGCWDFPFDDQAYRLFSGYEGTLKGYFA
ncbi:MAG TPA: peptidoglycan bridge formation glycyltransferase FemA/FemB family protein [Rectinemataceae bacterium]|nr:peptidoglycan bridge formation glycyltransferase FemA/FemB family protein [Rectinemataceae bacterium]